eukprot:6023737-Heterocapsa_arctica.AAC.1
MAVVWKALRNKQLIEPNGEDLNIRIIIFAKICHINTEIRSYGNDTKISNGGEVFQDKECTTVVYCNFLKWGDQPNHYDLLHHLPDVPKQGKKFTTI